MPESPNPSENPETLVKEDEIDKLIEKSREDQEASRQFMEPGGSVKRKRGRPKKEPEQEPVTPTIEPAFDFTEPCKTVFQVTSQWLVAYTASPKMALQITEIDSLGLVWGKVCNRYIPAYLSTHGELVAALIVTTPVLVRLKIVAGEIRSERESSMKQESEKIEVSTDD